MDGICPRCGAAVISGSLYCNQCGTAFAAHVGPANSSYSNPLPQVRSKVNIALIFTMWLLTASAWAAFFGGGAHGRRDWVFSEFAALLMALYLARRPTQAEKWNAYAKVGLDIAMFVVYLFLLSGSAYYSTTF